MKNDTKLYITGILWIPVFILGAVIGMIAGNFWAGLYGGFTLINRWIDNSEIMKEKP